MLKTHRPFRFTFLIFGIAFLVLLALPAAAQDPVTDDEVNAVAKDLYCPVCENTPLDVCPTQACQDWRDIIRQQLREGRTEAEIQDYFVAQYGARVLSAPPREGFDLIVWILPLAAVVVGAIFFGRYISDLRKAGEDEPDDTATVAQSTAPQPPPAGDDDDYVSRVEKELRES